MRVKVAILGTDRTYGENELVQAYALAGADTEAISVLSVKDQRSRLDSYGIIVLPEGSSMEDYDERVREELLATARRHRMILGIGSGFGVLLELGLLPCPKWSWPLELTGHEPRIRLERDPESPRTSMARLHAPACLCLFTLGTAVRELCLDLNADHYRLACDERTLRYLRDHGLIAFRYADDEGPVTAHSIAGICSPNGTILGMIARPEARQLPAVLYPCGTADTFEPPGLSLFQESLRHAPLS
jgi:phosphoribosylformylglycinamidine (FGAM) synthase-like amidotransferase family enzyme